LILLDAPLFSDPPPRKVGRERTTLRLPYAHSRGGILLPQLYSEATYNLFDSLKAVFRHIWQYDLLLGIHDGLNSEHKPPAIPIQPFIYLLSSSLWQSKLRCLDVQIKHISFREIRNPNIATNDRLHDCREDLAQLRAGVAEINMNIPASLSAYFDGFSIVKTRHHQTHLSPTADIQHILVEAEKLEAFLVQTFQLLMSSLCVRDSAI
jgi:hypothetical protein